MDFSAYILDSLLPANMCGDNGTAFFGSMGDEKNDLQLRTTQSVLLRFPTKTHPTALPNCGVERQIERGPEESDESYATRLESGFDLWKWSGTDRGILTAMDTSGVPAPLDILPGEDWPSDWKQDGLCWVVSGREWDPLDTSHWAKFFVLVSANSIAGANAGTWASGVQPVWQTQIRKWKDAQATCPAVYVISSPQDWANIWAPTGFWGDGDEGDWEDGSQYPVTAIDIGES